MRPCATKKSAVPENIHTPPMEGFLFCIPPLLPGNSGLSSYIASKIIALNTPRPLGISNDLLQGGYGFFLELHNGNTQQNKKLLEI